MIKIIPPNSHIKHIDLFLFESKFIVPSLIVLFFDFHHNIIIVKISSMRI